MPRESICLLLIDDGREDYLERCLKSLAPTLEEFAAMVSVNDPDHELGFAGAIQKGWEQVLQTGCEFVFHVESDFVFDGAVPLDRMVVLARSRSIAQVSLKRQPCNERELAAGGIVEADPDDFTEWTLTTDLWRERYTVHRRYFTTTPSLYRTELCERGWPQVVGSEGHFAISLFDEFPEMQSAIWGRKFDPPRVEHIGRERAGCGY